MWYGVALGKIDHKIMEKNQIDEFNKIILDNIPVSVITIDEDGYITSANKFYRGVSWAEDYHSHNVFTGEFFEREKLIEDYKKLLTDGTPFRRDNCHEKNSEGEDGGQGPQRRTS